MNQTQDDTEAILESTEVVGFSGVHHVGGIVTLISYIYLIFQQMILIQKL